MKKIRVILALMIIVSLWASTVYAADNERINGKDRYATAVEISKAGWKESRYVVIARGDDFPDALAGTPLAYQLNAPILLTPGSALHEATKAEIKRLGATSAVILGGTGAISKEVEEELYAIGILEVDRIAGNNRYETAKLIADRVGYTSGEAIVVSGSNFPDALAIAPYAAQNGHPILLTQPNVLRDEVKQALKNVKRTIVIGGTGAVSQKVFDELPKPKWRYEGRNRYDTAVTIIEKFYENPSKAYVATGQSFADALTGSVLAAKNKAPIILTTGNKLHPNVYRLLYEGKLKNFTLLGGTGALANRVLDELKKPNFDNLGFYHPRIKEFASAENFDVGNGVLLFKGVEYPSRKEYKNYTLKENFNKNVNKQIYKVAESMLDPKRYTLIKFEKQGKDSVAVVAFGPTKGLTLNNNEAFHYWFYEGNKTDWFMGEKQHPIFSLRVPHLWYDDVEYARKHDLMEPQYTEPLKRSIYALFSDDVAKEIYSFVIKQYKRAAKDREQHTIETHTVKGVKIQVMIIRGYPELHFYNVK